MGKLCYIVVGYISFVLGIVGVVVPVLPTVPFLLLTAICFGKGSKKLHAWFVGTKVYKDNLETYIRGQGMTKRAKVRIMATVTVVMIIGFALMRQTMVGRVALLTVWGMHVLYFTFKIKTIEKENEDSIH